MHRTETPGTDIQRTPAPHAPRHCALRNARGISLMETVVALGLFAITAASMGDFLVQQIRQANDGHLDTLAYSLAADALELARAETFGSLAGASTTYDQGGVTFTTTTQVEDDTPVAGVKTVTAQVSWIEPSGPKTISVPTIYTEITNF